MSDNNPESTPPPTPSAKTSAVPLKKETVRITLRARPGAGVAQPREATTQVPTPSTGQVPTSATAQVPNAATMYVSLPSAVAGITPASRATSPIQLPSGPLPPPAARPATAPVQVAPPMPAPVAPASFPPAPSAPRPPVPTVGGAPRPPGAPPPAPSAPRPPLPAATVPLAKAPSAPKPMVPPGAKVEAGATTVALSPKPPMAKPVGGTGTAPMVKDNVGGTTSQLPKATVKLQQTVGLAQAPQVAAPAPAAVARPAAAPAEEVYEEKNPEAGLVPLSILCSVLAVVLTVLNLFSNDKLQMWSENSALMAPAPNDPKWEQRQPDGSYVSKFSETLRNITKSIAQ